MYKPDIGDRQLRIGYTEGSVAIGAKTVFQDCAWVVEKAVVSRSARRLMEGWVSIPKAISCLHGYAVAKLHRQF
ncbi:2-methylaconitate cis-trans isomerase PrpF family protein [Pseudomonas sp. CBSPBW29]|nr:2-methylaconitate cis-trans isomerase PrpF family protein [Pseudomonas sp. CBS]WEL43550.1 2-methylaconitate cis-trans isomerase PrpF family protein [Pseudomonas sp. CBSPBW29]WEL64622.1 2-methylaconitate cis-trans isomerase PrpF family protein [Pseudomonas sp. CBSPGW29]WEL68087.1 2-methylaconitate cis-trans isomerase PrpF family protein [Pseudomonas sp. CBSPCGW29]WEL75111.1 2-methylaconitate cis-trans isomerase PrpF family protein [Pseudomonas sp. CBSPAW29]WEL80644.1 2-methylaconitate cis-tr